MHDEGGHAAFVDAWLARTARSLSSAHRLELFEAALGALWARTETTLGEVTLTAIAGRVLYTAAERFPPFSSLRVELPRGIDVRDLRERGGSVREAELTAGIRFVLVELLTVLGNLTAEILTPDLHAALAAVALQPVSFEKRSPRKPAEHERTTGEGK